MFTTRAPIPWAICCDWSKLPLSAIITSPSSLTELSPDLAACMHAAIVSASLRQGITIETNINQLSSEFGDMSKQMPNEIKLFLGQVEIVAGAGKLGVAMRALQSRSAPLLHDREKI